MKKFKYLLFIIILTLVSSTFIGCTLKKDMSPSSFLEEPNLIDKATFYNSESEKQTYFSFNNNVTDYMYVKFENETELNTIALFGNGRDIEKFQIFATLGNKEELIYEQDYLDSFRYITFSPITTRLLRLNIVSEKAYTFDKIQAYNVKNKNKAFRQTAYLTCESIQTQELDDGHMRNITDIILFGASNFNLDGTISIDIPTFETALNKVRAMETKLTKNYTIYINLLCHNHPKEAFTKNRNNLISNINEVLTKYDLDGVAFDYEYPYTNEDYKNYSNFLVELKESLNGKKLATAMADWALRLSAKAKKAIDVVEIMAYDLFDFRGNHSAFSLDLITPIQKCLNAGFTKEQLDIGIPFYARPVDMGPDWPPYNGYAEKLGKFGNYIHEPYRLENGEMSTTFGKYFNGYQMVYDKIRYAVDFGIGGAMFWHYSCDLPSTSPLSLLNATNNALNYR